MGVESDLKVADQLMRNAYLSRNGAMTMMQYAQNNPGQLAYAQQAYDISLNDIAARNEALQRAKAAEQAAHRNKGLGGMLGKIGGTVLGGVIGGPAGAAVGAGLGGGVGSAVDGNYLGAAQSIVGGLSKLAPTQSDVAASSMSTMTAEGDNAPVVSGAVNGGSFWGNVGGVAQQLMPMFQPQQYPIMYMPQNYFPAMSYGYGYPYGGY